MVNQSWGGSEEAEQGNEWQVPNSEEGEISKNALDTEGKCIV